MRDMEEQPNHGLRSQGTADWIRNHLFLDYSAGRRTLIDTRKERHWPCTIKERMNQAATENIGLDDLPHDLWNSYAISRMQLSCGCHYVNTARLCTSSFHRSENGWNLLHRTDQKAFGTNFQWYTDNR